MNDVVFWYSLDPTEEAQGGASKGPPFKPLSQNFGIWHEYRRGEKRLRTYVLSVRATRAICFVFVLGAPTNWPRLASVLFDLKRTAFLVEALRVDGSLSTFLWLTKPVLCFVESGAFCALWGWPFVLVLGCSPGVPFLCFCCFCVFDAAALAQALLKILLET